jgi:hypothetical protein
MSGYHGNSTKPQGIFWELKNQRKFMDWAGKQLNFKEMSEIGIK